MEKRIINPWTWQDGRDYAQAVEVKNVESTLYISGQTAIDDNGISSNDDMRTQISKALENLKKVILQADFEVKNIVRLNIYTTNHEEFFNNFDVFQNWITEHQIQQTTTAMEVKTLFETLKVEFEATVVK
ncbi:Enamine deaminase RidA, house cleaning of reactive enamine intermediates, YjgF/YER057c/UK114 family [Chryseobacterium arachidis]|uniref:Enamine deaminase RidA, house cleaning of reactive enamine intermediates, YjgF/YER057c/UK114 family n=1 Tax=Chryseobacterium arachidis TaxID=1416778 RepID=A0A1M5FUP8_9FLAO|nr:RidA family protein [Chryseobacterium arachidis]SHF95124.1 Enamine deaminase RidA, house cleaning of reactive enamine intermediates, YjgF/YER057c/UK114 family [Chryseobacterium arachidis]